MPYYRIYSVTEDGHIRGVPEAVECDDDRGAIDRAKALLDGLDLEVWDGPRRVAVLKSDQRA
jgi:hypothetical protein